jgi:hypothetical protein
MKEKLKITWAAFLEALGCKPWQVELYEQMHDANEAKILADRVKQIDKVKSNEH